MPPPTITTLRAVAPRALMAGILAMQNHRDAADPPRCNRPTPPPFHQLFYVSLNRTVGADKPKRLTSELAAQDKRPPGRCERAEIGRPGQDYSTFYSKGPEFSPAR